MRWTIRRGLPVVLLVPALVATSGCGGSERGQRGEDAERIGENGAPGRASGYNLLLVTVDTLRADRLGCYGQAVPDLEMTPNIDRLARSGVLFEQATAPAPITLPSHASIFTGLDVPNHGVRHNTGFRLGSEHPTLAEVLRERGYATAAVVGAYVLDERYGLARGFDVYDDEMTGATPDPLGVGFIERPADAVVDAASRWLDLRQPNDARPFFLWVHLFDPHSPYSPPVPYRERFAPAGPWGAYDGEVAFADAELGRLLDGLRERDLLDSTLVVLTSDHGEALGEHGELTHGALIYESTMQVPLILSNPVLFPEPLRADDRVVGLIDLFPTLLDLLGVDRSGYEVDGINALVTPDPDRAVYIESMLPLLDFGWASLHGLRLDGRKYVLAPTPEYYDLLDDPGEQRNLHPGNGEIRALARRLDERLARWPDPMDVLRAETPLAGEEIERLAALGYVRVRAGEPELGLRDPKTMMGVANRIQQAGLLSARGDHEAALAAIESAIAEDPTSGKAWYMATRIHDRMGRYEQAEECLRYALALSPRADGYVTLARYALNRRDSAAFEQALAEAERLDPDEAGIHIGRGHGFAVQGRLDDALAEFEKAIEMDPVRHGAHAREQIERLRELMASR